MTIEARITIDESDFDVGAEYARMQSAHAGAIVLFTGNVRVAGPEEETGGRSIEALELEHYPGVTERSVEGVTREAIDRWPLLGLRVIHRVGTLRPGDQIVLVLAASEHRDAAFEAASFVMDYLKTRAVFWKREIYADGARWVESRNADHAAAARWQESAPTAAGE